MSYQQLTSAQASPEVPVNENMAALGQAFAFSHDVTADTGLVVGITRGRFNGATLADTTVTATDDATNYIVAHRSTGACSVSTGTTNWNDTATYGRVGIAVFASGVLTYHDERLSSGGIYDHGGSAAGTVTSVALSVPAEFSVAGSPVTTSGTLAVSKATQSANRVWAGPTSGAAAEPGFRALVAADLPVAPTIETITYAATITVALAGKPSGTIFRCTLTGDVTVEISGGTDGQKFILELTQDGTGSRLVTLSGTYFRFGTDITAFTATTSASKLDRIGAIYNSAASKADVLAVTKGF